MATAPATTCGFPWDVIGARFELLKEGVDFLLRYRTSADKIALLIHKEGLAFSVPRKYLPFFRGFRNTNVGNGLVNRL